MTESTLEKIAVETMTCPVCFDILMAPIIGQCGHMMCSEHCRMMNNCPVCRRVNAFKENVSSDSIRAISLLLCAVRARGDLSPRKHSALNELIFTCC